MGKCYHFDKMASHQSDIYIYIYLVVVVVVIRVSCIITAVTVGVVSAVGGVTAANTGCMVYAWYKE